MEDALHLARAQFGLNIAFHILFPTITIGLAWFLVYFRVKLMKTGDTWEIAVPADLGYGADGAGVGIA